MSVTILHPESSNTCVIIMQTRPKYHTRYMLGMHAPKREFETSFRRYFSPSIVTTYGCDTIIALVLRWVQGVCRLGTTPLVDVRHLVGDIGNFK